MLVVANREAVHRHLLMPGSRLYWVRIRVRDQALRVTKMLKTYQLKKDQDPM